MFPRTNQQQKPLVVYDNQGKYLGSTPFRVNERNGIVQVINSRGVIVNSQLRADEWRMIDSSVQEAATVRLQLVADLRQMNLVRNVPSLGTMTVQYAQISEMTEAEVTMEGESRPDRALIDYKLQGSPLPIIHKEFKIGERLLAASRMGGTPLDTSNAAAASRVVAEKQEDLAIDGKSDLVFDGNTLYGITSEPNRLTDTAGNLGGGDWGTLSNIIPTIAGAIGALNATTNNYFGPYMIYAAQTQFNQANLNYYSDGSPDTPAQRIKKLDGVAGFKALPKLQDGEVVVIQMTPDVIVWWEHMGISVIEWVSPDGMTNFFKVIAVGAPQPKSEYYGNSGIFHITGA